MSDILSTLADVARQLEAAKVDYLIGGSLASSVWGEQRATHDADLAAILSIDQIKQLESAFEWPLFAQVDSLKFALSEPTEFACGQITNGETMDKVDLFLLPSSEYSKAQLKRKVWIQVTPDLRLPFASAEDTVIAKLRWFELGNRVSDKQWNDIVQVLEVQHGDLDEEYLNRWAEHFRLRELLDDARSQAITD